jgi:hypothetical protein
MAKGWCQFDAPLCSAAVIFFRAEIDRGEVVLARPKFDKDGHKMWHPPVSDRPTLTLYARVGKGEVALGRWPTTIGGWKTIARWLGRKIRLGRGQGALEVGDGLALAFMDAALDLERKDVAAPSVLEGLPRTPEARIEILDHLDEDHVVRPGDLGDGTKECRFSGGTRQLGHGWWAFPSSGRAGCQLGHGSWPN